MTAPGGYDIADALRGEWTPESRPLLNTIITFLERPDLQSAVAQLAAIEPGGWRPCGPAGISASAFARLREAAKLFVVRARYHRAEMRDTGAAINDLASASRLLYTASDSGEMFGVLTASACQSLLDAELVRFASENSLAVDQARKIILTLDFTTRDLADQWRHATSIAILNIRGIVDSCWSRRADGNGTLVLSRLERAWEPAVATDPGSGAWNVLGLFFSDRRTAERKIDRLTKVHEFVAELPFREALTTLQVAEQHPTFNLIDGPLVYADLPSPSRVYQGVVRGSAENRAAIVSVLLSAYRCLHGRYPESLDALTELGISDVPFDPFSGKPFVYRAGPHEFHLYSVGPDGVDDGGTRPKPDLTPRTIDDGCDLVFTGPRPPPSFEPQLQELTP